MKVPYNLQRMLTRNQNRYLRRNGNGETWTTDPNSVTNSNNSFQAFLQKTSKSIRATEEPGVFEVVTVRKGRRVTKRKGKRSSNNSARVTITVKTASSKNTFGRKSCAYLVQKAKRVFRAAKRAARIERESA